MCAEIPVREWLTITQIDVNGGDVLSKIFDKALINFYLTLSRDSLINVENFAHCLIPTSSLKFKPRLNLDMTGSLLITTLPSIIHDFQVIDKNKANISCR